MSLDVSRWSLDVSRRSLDVSRWSLDVSRCLHISKIVTFINMVITGVKNESPDMILTAFDGKFDKKKDELPPGAHRPQYTSDYSILGI